MVCILQIVGTQTAPSLEILVINNPPKLCQFAFCCHTSVCRMSPRTHVIKWCSYCLALFPFVSWLFGNLKPGRKVVKPEGANLGPRAAHSPLWHKQNKILTLPTVRQPIQSACVWGTVTDSLLWRAVFENLFCMVTSALLQLHIWTDVNSEQDQDSLCS